MCVPGAGRGAHGADVRAERHGPSFSSEPCGAEAQPADAEVGFAEADQDDYRLGSWLGTLLPMNSSRRVIAAALLSLTAAAAGSPERGFNGFIAVRGGRVVAQENARRLFAPGSVQKLLVTAAALHHLGPEYRVTTAVRGTGGVSDGTLGGDLILTAAGDPTWNERFFEDDPHAPLRSLARQLAARGLKRVGGDLVIDTGRFPGRAWPVSRPGSELAYGYAAPTSALAVDESTVRVEIAPGRRAGEPGTLRPLGRATAFDWVNRIVTAPRERHEKGTVDFLPEWQGRTVVVRGEYPVSEPAYTVAVAVPHPDLFAAWAIGDALAEEGVAIAGTVRIEAGPRGLPGEELAAIRSPPLAELLPPILTDSHNWYAEMLLRILAAEVRGVGRDDEGLAVVESFLEEEVGLEDDAFVLDDASGLSPYNLLSPEAVVGLLAWVRRQAWAEVYQGALAVPGRGTLKAWGRLPALAAKTGSIRQTVALAGYLQSSPPSPQAGLQPRSAEPVIFAAFLNHRQEERPALRAEIAAWLEKISGSM